MKTSLPLWFQTVAVILLAIVFMATVGWVWEQDRTFYRSGVIVNLAHNTIYVMMPAPIVFLGLRFVWEFFRTAENHWVSLTFGGLALLFLVPVLLTLAIVGPSPRLQVNRGASVETMRLLAMAHRQPTPWS